MSVIHDFTQYDITDTVDLDREWEVPNWDYTTAIPPIEGTTDLHPMDCRCLPCQAEQEYIDSQYGMCECEIDWRCGACGPGPSALERQNDEWATRENAPEWAQ